MKSALHSTPRSSDIGKYRPGSARRSLHQSGREFSRLRGAEIGIHHKVADPYSASYATEMTWREDNRRAAEREQATFST